VRGDVPFEVVELGRGSRLESVAPLAYAARARRALDRGGTFDVVHWLFPGEPEEALFVPPAGMPFVVGPLFARWPNGRGRRLRAGDAVKAALRPVERRRHERGLAAATVLAATPNARANTHVVAPGVDPSRFPVGPIENETVAFVGRLERAKGVRELVEAAARVIAARPDARFVFAGDGSERSWIERRAADLGIAHGVRVLGAVAPDEIPGVLAGSALLCIPSHGEPYGMAALEAMAAGRAVVATDAGGLRFLVGEDGGRLVPVGDAGALADALVALLADPAGLVEIGRRNRERVERELSLDRMLDRLEAVYLKVAA
jgi:glycosyltransferase involved in cell wall biosynthesis